MSIRGIISYSDRSEPSLKRNTITTVAHELGHTGGLGHLNSSSKDNFNLMKQEYYVKGNINQAIQLKHSQVREIRDNYILNRLKTISPVRTHKNGLKYLPK